MSLWAKFQCCCPSNKADPISVVQLWRKDLQLFQLDFLTGRALLKFLRVIWDQKVSSPLGCLLGQGEQERLPENKIKMIQWPRASYCIVKVEKVLKGSRNSIPSPSPSVKIQIMGRKVCLRCKGKTLLGDVNKLFVFNSLLTTPWNILPLHIKKTFLPIIWIFTEGEGDGI